MLQPTATAHKSKRTKACLYAIITRLLDYKQNRRHPARWCRIDILPGLQLMKPLGKTAAEYRLSNVKALNPKKQNI